MKIKLLFAAALVIFGQVANHVEANYETNQNFRSQEIEAQLQK